MLPNTCVILPAAGIGERMGLSTPKQYCQIMNRPLISYTIEAFEKIVQNVFVVISEDGKHELQTILKSYSHDKVAIVIGALTRHRSIWNGVKSVVEKYPETEVIVVHDAVRPFVDESTIRDVVNAALEHGAAGVTRPLVSTVISSNSDGFLDHSLDRSKYCASEMAQAFRTDIILTAYEKCTDYDLDFGTECLHLAQKYGNAAVKLLQGSDNLWKVTHRRDLYAADVTLRESMNSVLVVSDCCGNTHYDTGSHVLCVDCCDECQGKNGEINYCSKSMTMNKNSQPMLVSSKTIEREENLSSNNTVQMSNGDEINSDGNSCSAYSASCPEVPDCNQFSQELQSALNVKHNSIIPLYNSCVTCFTSERLNQSLAQCNNVNNVIFVHLSTVTNEDLEKIESITAKLINYDSRKSFGVIHVFESYSIDETSEPIRLSDQSVMKFIKQAADRVNNMNNVIVNGVVFESDVKKLVNIISSLVFDHNKIYSGQTFFCN